MFPPSYPPPPALPAGVVLQVDGQAGGADRLRGRQRHLPEADVPAARVLPPLQRRFHRDQEEEVSGTAPPPDAAFDWCESATAPAVNITCSDM